MLDSDFIMRNPHSPERMNQETACAFLYREHLVELLNLSRQRGVDEHESHDLVQELFLRIFHLGLFRVLAERPYQARRAWLVRTLRWMIINQHRHRSRLRRGGAVCVESLDVLAGEGLEITSEEAPDVLHDRRWAMNVLERGLIRLRSTLKPAAWPAMEGILAGESRTTSGKQRVAAHRARVRLREMIRSEARYHDLLAATISS
jgi:DNA-directed RNA polymerase specialized sigma24 family protein